MASGLRIALVYFKVLSDIDVKDSLQIMSAVKLHRQINKRFW